ncbi:MAG: hypothetical protein AAFV87_06735 [Pseudomonadota bacterium]
MATRPLYESVLTLGRNDLAQSRPPHLADTRMLEVQVAARATKIDRAFITGGVMHACHETHTNP